MPRTSTPAWGGLLVVSLPLRHQQAAAGARYHHDVECVDRTTLDPEELGNPFILFEGTPAAEVLWVLTGLTVS